MSKLITNSSSQQLFASGTQVRPVYGMGATSYGINGFKVRGREAHIQMREQNSGFSPSEDYRAAKFLPGLWRDLERNGCPVVLDGGVVVGVAGLIEASGAGQVAADGADAGATIDEVVFAHQVMPANAGVPQTLLYTDKDAGVCYNPSTLSFTTGTMSLFADNYVGGQAQDILASGNKPLAYNPTNEHSSSWEDVFANQKYSHQVTMKTQWNVMYPVSNGFMYGTSVAGAATADDVSGMGASANAVVTRGMLGFGSFAAFDNAVVLNGIQFGDQVMPNPWLPGTLMSIRDFAVAAAAQDATHPVVIAVANELGMAAADVAGSVPACLAYGHLHKVGLCFKRQARAYADNSGASTVISGHDIFSDTYRYQVTLPGLGLSGADTAGIEADQEAARKFASATAAGATKVGIDVVFIQFCIK